MPKQLQIDPGQTYAVDSVLFADIPVHAYAPDLELERARWGDERLRRRVLFPRPCHVKFSERGKTP